MKHKHKNLVPLSSHQTIVQKAKAALSKRSDITFAYLFGSYAYGQPTPLSDIDIAVYLDFDYNADVRLEILGNLIDALKSDKIDLVILNTAPLPLKFRVLKFGRLLVDNSPFIRHAFESATMRLHMDFSKLEKRILKQRFLNG